jgi:hypothetical protein
MKWHIGPGQPPIPGEPPPLPKFPDPPKSKPLTIPAGALVTITLGEYSDYYIYGVFRASRDIDTDALRKQWLAGHHRPTGIESQEATFLDWVVRLGCLEPIGCLEWHLNDYCGDPFENEVSTIGED